MTKKQSYKQSSNSTDVSVKFHCHIENKYVPCPPEKVAEWNQAIHIIAEMLKAEFEEMNNHQSHDSPICITCKCELHLTPAGEHVCRNEACPNYRW